MYSLCQVAEFQYNIQVGLTNNAKNCQIYGCLSPDVQSISSWPLVDIPMSIRLSTDGGYPVDIQCPTDIQWTGEHLHVQLISAGCLPEIRLMSRYPYSTVLAQKKNENNPSDLFEVLFD